MSAASFSTTHVRKIIISLYWFHHLWGDFFGTKPEVSDGFFMGTRYLSPSNDRVFANQIYCKYVAFLEGAVGVKEILLKFGQRSDKHIHDNIKHGARFITNNWFDFFLNSPFLFDIFWFLLSLGSEPKPEILQELNLRWKTFVYLLYSVSIALDQCSILG